MALAIMGEVELNGARLVAGGEAQALGTKCSLSPDPRPTVNFTLASSRVMSPEKRSWASGGFIEVP